MKKKQKHSHAHYYTNNTLEATAKKYNKSVHLLSSIRKIHNKTVKSETNVNAGDGIRLKNSSNIVMESRIRKKG